ncbi:putative B3 domain-containing protein At3g24850 [Salvia hispanica]|uniref:putative B3 domain-containing protein At3g24850 n=1 Tax=Salvia hispanica TaxID=49212 RepID=UPI002009D988|nr:putative B3 domain-containing protein At3g24850 [Salvia hispanica]
MVLANITRADFQPDELDPTANPFVMLLAVVARESERIAAAEISTNPASRRKTLSRTLPPAEGLTTMIQNLSLRRGIAPPTPPRLVIQKLLFATDLSAQHNRFSIPISQIDNDFLTEAEKQCLPGSNYLEVKIMASEMSWETVKLSRWDMRKGRGRKMSSMYVINGRWNAFVRKNNLSVGMVVQLWFFRLQEELCFAVVQLPAPA